MNKALRVVLRRLTRATRPLALRTAGTAESATSVIRHVGRRSGQSYDTPVVAVEHEDGYLVALPYGNRTDWSKNVMASGRATLVTRGSSIEVDRPEVVPMSEVTRFFATKEQRLHRRFGVTECMRLHRA